MGCGVEGLCRIVWGLGFEMSDLVLIVWGLGCEVKGY